MKHENIFLQRFTNILVHQEQQLPGNFPIAPKGSGFKSVAEILGSSEIRDHYSKKYEEDEV